MVPWTDRREKKCYLTWDEKHMYQVAHLKGNPNASSSSMAYRMKLYSNK